MNGRSMFLETVSDNQEIVQYVRLFRMPLFLTMLDEEFKKNGDACWENAGTTEETVRKVMPGTLKEFGVPGDKIDEVIGQCLAGFEKKKGE